MIPRPRADNDYTVASGTLTFAQGAQGAALGQLITVGTQDDRAVEPDEEFRLALTGATNAGVGTANANGIIRNDDVDISIVDVTAAEGTFAKPTLIVDGIATVRANGLRVELVGNTSNGTATAPGDYTAFVNSSTTVAGSQQIADSIAIKKDGTNEAQEIFFYSIVVGGATSAEVEVDITGGGLSTITIGANSL
jgi:hypothetical protein